MNGMRNGFSSVSASSAISSRDADVFFCVLLSALWVVPALAIGIEGNFPLNDDWAHAQATRHLLETGQFERSRWTYAPIITNVGVGAAASFIFGFSFEVLRATSVVLGWAGILASYGMCRIMGVAAVPSAILASMVALNPVYLNLSYTFMTDVPFTAMAVGSLALFMRGLETGSLAAYLGSVILAVGATLSRQPGLAIFVALGVALIVQHAHRGGRRAVVRSAALVGLVFILLAFLSWTRFFELRYIVPQYFQSPSLGYQLFRNGLTAFVYLGLFLAPISIFSIQWTAHSGRRIALGSVVLAIAALVILELNGLRMPLGINIIQDYGLGPQTLYGPDYKPQAAPAGFWIGLTAIGLWGGIVAAGSIVSGLWQERKSLGSRPDIVLLVIFVAAFTLPLLIRAPFFDRYLLPVLPPLGALMLALSPTGERSSLATMLAPLTLVSLLGIWSVIGTRDYMEHHRARWDLLSPLVGQGVTPGRIDGGFEFTGWYNYDSELSRFRRNHDRVGRWVEDDKYVLSFMTKIDGYEPIARAGYLRWFTARVESITLHRREG